MRIIITEEQKNKIVDFIMKSKSNDFRYIESSHNNSNESIVISRGKVSFQKDANSGVTLDYSAFYFEVSKKYKNDKVILIYCHFTCIESFGFDIPYDTLTDKFDEVRNYWLYRIEKQDAETRRILEDNFNNVIELL